MSPLNIPKSTQKLFWSCRPTSLDSQKHKAYIIHQVLQYGDLDDYQWLKQQYSQEDIKGVFISQPRSTYQPCAFNFIKNYLIPISESLPKEKYVQSAF